MTMPRTPIRPAVLALLLALGGCAFAPDGKPPAVTQPAQYGVAPTPAAGATAQGVAQRFEHGARPVPEWWKRYGSAALDALVQEGLANSPDLAAAERNLAGAREQLRGQVNSSLMPAVDAGADATRRRALTMPNLPEPTARYNVFTGQVQARYDLDLFGAARFANLSLTAQFAQQAFQLESARRALAGNIVTGAISASALAQRVALNEKQALLARQVARDTQRRYELGAASQNDALDADQDAAALDARYPDGEIARLTLIDEAAQKEIAGLIEDTFAAAEGDSNDDEIEVLQAARDRLAALIDYIPAHERDWTPLDAA